MGMSNITIFAYNYHKSPQLLYHGGFTVITTTDTMVLFKNIIRPQ